MCRLRFRVSGSRALVTTILAGHVALLIISSRLQFPPGNEVGHVPAGIFSWETGSFRLYCVNPPLWRMLATLPTLLLRPKTESFAVPDSPGYRAEWEVARAFANDNADNYFN